MTALRSLQNRIRPGATLLMLGVIGAATYFEFIYNGPPTVYSIVLWIVVVPMLLATTVDGVQDHPLYQPLLYAGFVLVGTLQYLDGHWFLLAGLFIICGVLGLLSVFRQKRSLFGSG